MARRLQFLDMRGLVLGQDARDGTLDAHARAHGLRRALVVAREHDDRETERVEALDGLAARRLRLICRAEQADEPVVRREEERRRPRRGERVELLAHGSEAYAPLRHQALVAREIHVAVRARLDAAAERRGKARHGTRRDAFLRSNGEHGRRERMLAARLEPRGDGEQFLARDAERRDGCDARPALRDGARLVHDDGIDRGKRLERLARLDEDAVFRALARANHDGDGRREPERTRTGDHEHADGNGERELDARAEREPDTARCERDEDDGRHEDAGDLVRHARDRRLRGAGLIDEIDDLADRRILADALRLHDEPAILVDGRRRHFVARPLGRRDALAGDGRFIDGRLPFDDDAISRQPFARLHDDMVAHAELGCRYGDLGSAAQHDSLLRREIHELLERPARLALGPGLEIFPDGDERHDHAR